MSDVQIAKMQKTFRGRMLWRLFLAGNYLFHPIAAMRDIWEFEVRRRLPGKSDRKQQERRQCE